MPLVKPDEEPRQEQVPNIDQMVREKTENFWSMLRLAVSKLAGLGKLRVPTVIRQGWSQVWTGKPAKRRKR